MDFIIDHAYTLILLEGGFTIKKEVFYWGFSPENGDHLFKTNCSKTPFPLQRDLDKVLVFDNHDLPLIVETETSFAVGTHEFNFVGDDPQPIREFILKHCLNLDEYKKAISVLSPTNRAVPRVTYDTPLFPEEREDGAYGY